MSRGDWGTRISTNEEFPHVGIYEAPGPVYTLSFLNREPVGAARIMLAVPAWTLMFILGVWGMTDGSAALAEWGVPRYVTALAIAAAVIAAGAYMLHPPMVRREIVMDFPRDRVEIFRGSRRTLDRKLSMLKNVTIADHPDTELERARRGAGKGPGPLEKQHCLMGWFGAGDTGVNQEILLTRYEFPKIHSLFEVGQAMIWARNRYLSAAPSPGMQFVPAGEEPPSIKPPLD